MIIHHVNANCFGHNSTPEDISRYEQLVRGHTPGHDINFEYHWRPKPYAPVTISNEGITEAEAIAAETAAFRAWLVETAQLDEHRRNRTP